MYRVRNITQIHHRFKIDKNAQELLLSGIAVIHPDCNMILVEGGPNALRKYKHLLLERIDWNEIRDTGADGPLNNGSDSRGDESTKPPNNECKLIWEGEYKQPLFKNFKTRTLPIESKVREILRKNSCEEFWELAKSAQNSNNQARP